MFCKNCEKKLETGAAFCPDCGAKVMVDEAIANVAPTKQTNDEKKDSPLDKLPFKLSPKSCIIAGVVFIVVLFMLTGHFKTLIGITLIASMIAALVCIVFIHFKVAPYLHP